MKMENEENQRGKSPVSYFSHPACDDNPTISSPTSPTDKVVVFGGGITGLTVAWELSKRMNTPVLLIEKSSSAGGLAGSITKQGLTFDLGSHRIHKQYDPEALDMIRDLLGNDLKERPRRGLIRISDRFL